MDKQTAYCLAADIGGSKVDIALVDPAGKIEGQIQNFPVPFNSRGEADPDRLIELFRPFVAWASQEKKNLRGIGLSICGNIDMVSGEAILIPNLHWRYLPFGEMIHKEFDLPVHAATDTRQAALAEHLWGIARGVKHFAWCTVGTGYGGYLFLDGQLYEGSHTFAGNFGHITLDEENGYPCGCGRRGCFETFVAGPAIARAGQTAADNGKSPRLVQLAGGKSITARLVVEAATAGDLAAKEILEQVIRLIAINLGGMVNLLDLEMIVMGGGVVHGIPDFLPRIRIRIRDFLMTEEAKRDLRIEKETFSNSPLYGAAVDFFMREGIPRGQLDEAP